MSSTPESAKLSAFAATSEGGHLKPIADLVTTAQAELDKAREAGRYTAEHLSKMTAERQQKVLEAVNDVRAASVAKVQSTVAGIEAKYDPAKKTDEELRKEERELSELKFRLRVPTDAMLEGMAREVGNDPGGMTVPQVFTLIAELRSRGSRSADFLADKYPFTMRNHELDPEWSKASQRLQDLTSQVNSADLKLEHAGGYDRLSIANLIR